ncbi:MULTISPECIES: hypothetical protein [Streptomyces]|uniref:Integral membrane protein n=2 Tax=Streptomyces TaxID=1883 RepID=A0A3R7I125_9ACTN|nr:MULTISPECIES: hypothetical protein [Streptomyces]KNE80648.1 hypothetical protein ADZ36_20760 [Streptomyces fradiae]OFA51865.1 hypothetical protein BEN35_13110 [Streptomyces fradiae]PQM23278.1 hypothetical protein Sfr7A_11915 [Streptomyces xinghaiensis]RKM94840.1 hypothetical protein SFRA_016380 [Streptomyces xinghaiensis]RNC74720.1 hypothetical protein DC095_008570 [Streptomyces xinghaiensis]
MAGVTADAVGALRLARAGVFAAVCVVTTALGHALTSGGLLLWWAVGLAFAVTAPGAWWLTGRERGAVAVVGTTVGAQALLHLLFSLAHRLVPLPDATTVGGPGTGHGLGAHQHGAPTAVTGTGAVADPSLLSAVTHGNSTGMLLAHLLAALVCGLWLWRGEAAAHRLARALAALLFAPLRRLRDVPFHPADARDARRPCRSAAAGWERPQPVPVSLRHAVVRRGPPRGRSALTRPSPEPLLAVRP